MKILQRVMYVEDETDIQAVVKLALEMFGGFTVITCSSGQEALQQVVAFAPDLILLDVMMPGMDGPTTLQKLRQLPGLAATPVVFITAKVQPQEVEHLKLLGALDVIAKPFEPTALVDKLQTIFAKGKSG